MDAALAAMQTSGELDSLARKWFSPPDPGKPARP
jgi:ABC-type amino acid transport substrate-binding protein